MIWACIALVIVACFVAAVLVAANAIIAALSDHTGTLPDFPAHGGPSPSRGQP